MTVDEINMPIFVAAFEIAYAKNQNDDLPYEELISQLKKETNLLYHMMVETVVHIKG